MKLIQGDVPDSYKKALEKSGICAGIYRPEHLRLAIRAFLVRELRFAEGLENKFEDKKSTEFFEDCINCERKVHTEAGKSHLFHKNIEVFVLRFCCSCYEQFKDTSFDDFPAQLIDNIRKKIKKYKKKQGLI
ncbi:MAG: hypothetical protein ACTSRI_21960 [Promethearchaeota archaeon]